MYYIKIVEQYQYNDWIDYMNKRQKLQPELDLMYARSGYNEQQYSFITSQMNINYNSYINNEIAYIDQIKRLESKITLCVECLEIINNIHN